MNKKSNVNLFFISYFLLSILVLFKIYKISFVIFILFLSIKLILVVCLVTILLKPRKIDSKKIKQETNSVNLIGFRTLFSSENFGGKQNE